MARTSPRPRRATASRTSRRSRPTASVAVGQLGGLIGHSIRAAPPVADHGGQDGRLGHLAAGQVGHVGTCRRRDRGGATERWPGSARVRAARRRHGCGGRRDDEVGQLHRLGRRADGGRRGAGDLGAGGGTVGGGRLGHVLAGAGEEVGHDPPLRGRRADVGPGAVDQRHVLGHGVGRLDGRLGRHGPAEELLADAGDLAVDLARLVGVGRVEQGQRQPRAGDVGQPLHGPVAADDAVVVAGAEQGPVARPARSSARASGRRGLGRSSTHRSTSQASSSSRSAIGRTSVTVVGSAARPGRRRPARSR